MGGGSIPVPHVLQSSSYLIDQFVRLRGFVSSYEIPITPRDVSELGECYSTIDRDIIFAMDQRYRAGMLEAAEFWKDR